MLKKVSAAVVLGAVVATASFASPMGPVRPQMGRWGVEVEASADDRDMESENTTASQAEAQNVNVLGRISYGLTDRFEVSARLGMADLDVDHTAGAAFARGNQFSGGSEFAWGAALGAILYDAGTWNIAGQGNYLAHSGHQSNTTAELDYSEWNLGAQLQGKWDMFVPYVGVKYSDASLEQNNATSLGVAGDFESADNVGVYGGAGWDFNPNWGGYVEGRFIDETSFGGGIRYTF